MDPSRRKLKLDPDGLQEFVPWRGWQSGPIGTFTDDTQLTIATVESLLRTGGTFDPEDLARTFLAIGRIRGVGRATAAAIDELRNGAPWWEAGQLENSAGNGAAMRAAPIGLLHAFDPTAAGLVQDAVLSAVPTHTHPVGVAGAVALAAGVAWCIRIRLAGATLDVDEFIEFVCAAVAGIEPEPTLERKPGGRAVKLVERLQELPELLTWPSGDEVFNYTYNGAFALESVPAAVYAFLCSPDDARGVILRAVNAGYDADTVASMGGNLAGAWCGAATLERNSSWWRELEDRDRLVGLADRLLDLALTRRAASPAPTASGLTTTSEQELDVS
jgi:ADP-ribosylglycohydrolase